MQIFSAHYILFYIKHEVKKSFQILKYKGISCAKFNETLICNKNNSISIWILYTALYSQCSSKLKNINLKKLVSNIIVEYP